jgi:hypothetical protein
MSAERTDGSIFLSWDRTWVRKPGMRSGRLSPRF